MRLINCFTLISWSSAAGFHDRVLLFVSFLIRLTDCHYFIIVLYFSVQLAAFFRHIASQNPSHDSSVCHLLSLRLHYGRRRHSSSSRRLRAFAYRCNTQYNVCPVLFFSRCKISASVSVSWAVTHTGKCYVTVWDTANRHLICSNRERQGQTVQRLIESGCLCWCCGGRANEKKTAEWILYARTKKTRELYVLLFPHLKWHVSHTSILIGEEKKKQGAYF